jgi:membrane protease YdiL (CAAX protease family)
LIPPEREPPPDAAAPTVPDPDIPVVAAPLVPAPPAPAPTATEAGVPDRPGASTFTIEGRAAPALFVVGWLGTLVGLGTIAIALLSGGSGGAPLLLFAGLVVLSVGTVAGAGSQGIERRARGVLPYRGPSPVLVFLASIPVSLLAVVAIGVPLTLLGLQVDGPFGRLAAVVAQALIYIGLIRLLVVDAGALSWPEMGVRRPAGGIPGELLTGALLAAPVILLTIPVAAILAAILPVTPVSPLPPTGETTGFAIQLVAGAIVAPIGEELLFRGLATTVWARAFGARQGLVLGALFFAFVHVLTITGSAAGEVLALMIVGFASRLPVALALGWLFLRRGTIWAPIGLHAAFNALLLVLGEIAFRSGLAP